MFISQKCKNGCFYPNSDRCVRCGHEKISFMAENHNNNGVISKPMGVDTKPSKKLEYKGHWILVDGNISELAFEKLKQKIKI